MISSLKINKKTKECNNLQPNVIMQSIEIITFEEVFTYEKNKKR